jgi:hypothetical protein
VVTDQTRTDIFAWYTLAGSLAIALGALAGGTVTRVLQQTAMPPVSSYRMVVILYAALGVLLAILFARLSGAAEATTLGEKTPSFSGRTSLRASRHCWHLVWPRGLA